MILYPVLALLNGIAATINKMVNLQAKKSLGTVNGTLINYLEGTVFSLILIFATGDLGPDPVSLLKAVPPLYLTGGFFGLFSMLLILNGMMNAKISFSTVVVLIGQLGTGFLIDSAVSGKIAPLKLAGLLLITFGIVTDSKIASGKKAESSPQKPQKTPRGAGRRAR
ncbi:DMT family transporter [Caproicibacter sp.]|uniref:DMT family transporter n=1 Tax=Caproicibacter sp. TaxID=2814884 RepID=UPI00398A1B60